jgi:hypothetical protein
MTIEHRQPTFKTFCPDAAAFIRLETGEGYSFEYQPKYGQIEIVFYGKDAPAAAKRFRHHELLQGYITEKKLILNRIRTAMREHAPARG